ncbi:MAG: SMC-Scp complex subunit ScpB [Halanaerobiaceae bacterium]
MNVNNLAAIEALLFTAPEPLSCSELADTVDVTLDEIKELLSVLKKEYNDKRSHGIQLKEYNGNYIFVTKEHLAPFIKKLHDVSKKSSLSQAARETLAIVAYRQPVTRGEIEEIRGVNAERTLSTLSKYNLIEEVGREESLGHPILYGTTEEFLQQFDINNLQDLPKKE